MPSSAVGKAVESSIARFHGDGTLAAPSLAWPARAAARRAVRLRPAVDGHVPARAAVDGARPLGAGVGGAADDHRIDARPRGRAAHRRADQRRARAPAPAARRAGGLHGDLAAVRHGRQHLARCWASASSRAPPAPPGIVIARAIVRDLHTGVAAARFFALLMLVNGLAPILAPLVGGELLHVTDWRGIFVVLAAIGAVLLVAAWAMLAETLAPEARHGGGLRATVRVFGGLVRRPRVPGLRAGDGPRLRRDGRLHRGLAVRAAGHLRRLAAALQRALRAQRRRHHRRQPGQPRARRPPRSADAAQRRVDDERPRRPRGADLGRVRRRAGHAAAELLRGRGQHRPRVPQRHGAGAGRPPARRRAAPRPCWASASSPPARWPRPSPGSAARTRRCRWRS